jgi:transglutaminase-like putative cysteine protease
MNYSVNVMNIAAGHQGTLETLRVMVSLINDGVRSNTFQSIAASITHELNGQDETTLIRSVDSWVRRYFEYESENIETVKSPLIDWQEIEENGYFTGDCDDVSVFEATVFKSLGFPVRLVAIRTQADNPDYLHVFIEVQTTNNQWIRLDPTVRAGLIHVSYGEMVMYV